MKERNTGRRKERKHYERRKESKNVRKKQKSKGEKETRVATDGFWITKWEQKNERMSEQMNE